MSLDSIVLWTLTVINSLTIMLVVRQMATLPKYNRPPGPRPGSVFGEWELTTLAGDKRRANQMPPEYVMLFVAERCGPCHALLAQLVHDGRPKGHFVIASDGDPAVLSRAASTPAGPMYDEYLGGVDAAFLQRFDITSTPYALAVRHGRIVSAGPARTPTELGAISEILRGAVSTATATT